MFRFIKADMGVIAFLSGNYFCRAYSTWATAWRKKGS